MATMPQQVGMSPEQIANFMPQMNEFLQQLLSGHFLDQGNPYLSQLISSIESDAQRNYQESIVPLERDRLNMSGAYGTALGALAQGRSNEGFNRGLMSQLAGTRTGLYESERDRMMQGLGLYSGETNAARQGLFGARNTDVNSVTALRNAAKMAAAQRFSASQAAGAHRYGSSLQHQLGMSNLKYNFLRDALGQSQNYNFWSGGPQAGLFGAPQFQQAPGSQPGGLAPPNMLGGWDGSPAFGKGNIGQWGSF